MKEARKGLPAIPYKLRVSVMTMADAYDWIAKQIENHPNNIFHKKIIAPKRLIQFYGIKNKAAALFVGGKSPKNS
jgi:phytoene/squalene synthetase